MDNNTTQATDETSASMTFGYERATFAGIPILITTRFADQLRLGTFVIGL